MTGDGWKDRAACRGRDTADWYADEDDRVAVQRAVLVCLGCPVKNVCGDWAIDRPETIGTWGGLTEKERRRMTRGTGRTDVA